MKKLKESEKIFILSILEQLYVDKILTTEEYRRCVIEAKKHLYKESEENINE